MITLKRKNGRILAQLTGMELKKSNAINNSVNSEHNEIPVSIAWLRPITGKGKEITLIGEQNEICVIELLDELDSNSRIIAEEELDHNYFVSHIERIIKTSVHLGNRYFNVMTDKGKCDFVVKNPFVSIRKYGVDGLHIRDTVGNLFVIESLKILDEKSKIELEKVI